MSRRQRSDARRSPSAEQIPISSASYVARPGTDTCPDLAEQHARRRSYVQPNGGRGLRPPCWCARAQRAKPR
eukprot:11998805-Alexandrium_andersonii.AAC.1